MTNGPPAVPVVPVGLLDATAIAERMRTALEPPRPSTRKLTFVISAEDGESTQLVAGQARDGRFEGGRALTVILAPPDAKGLAFLVEDRRDPQADVQWLWVPSVRRVRKLVAAEENESFFNTDFTYADLGFVRRDVAYKLLGKEDRAGVRSYKLESIPEQKWYLSRILTWVSVETSLPVERQFFDPAGALYKIERFQDVQAIDGIPTPLKIRMENIPAKSTTDLVVSSVTYDSKLQPSMLDPDHLREAASSPSWIWRASK
jgi:hypothetical protein